MVVATNSEGNIENWGRVGVTYRKVCSTRGLGKYYCDWRYSWLLVVVAVAVVVAVGVAVAVAVVVVVVAVTGVVVVVFVVVVSCLHSSRYDSSQVGVSSP